jgi:hypothetical protein
MGNEAQLPQKTLETHTSSAEMSTLQHRRNFYVYNVKSVAQVSNSNTRDWKYDLQQHFLLCIYRVLPNNRIFL